MKLLLLLTIVVIESLMELVSAFQMHYLKNHPTTVITQVTSKTPTLRTTTYLHAKRRKNEKAEDIFSNQWYEEVEKDSTPDDIFWNEMERQKSVAGIVPENMVDPLSALSSGIGNNSNAEGGGNSQKRDRNSKSSSGTFTNSIVGGGPARTLSEEKSTDAVLASFSAHAVDDNWLDEEYIEQMKLMNEESNIDLEEQDLLLEKQIEEWENEEVDEEEDRFNTNFSSHTNEPWDYYRPDGEIIEEDDELEDDEDQQNTIKIDLEKGK